MPHSTDISFSSPGAQQEQKRYCNKGAYIVLQAPDFSEPHFHCFEAILPRPKVKLASFSWSCAQSCRVVRQYRVGHPLAHVHLCFETRSKIPARLWSPLHVVCCHRHHHTHTLSVSLSVPACWRCTECNNNASRHRCRSNRITTS